MKDTEILDRIAIRLESKIDMDAELQIEGQESVDKSTLDTSAKVANYCSELLHFIWQQRLQEQKKKKKQVIV
mgnify:CR=1 FL=1|tara:strand:- start:1659 stop:1874 length:216 start_codon:yes stop_codon:yes gene_type:complete